MPKIFGFRLQAATEKLIGKFEDEVMLRHNNQQLLGTVYVDVQENQWAVAFAYNYARNPGLHGPENLVEARYSIRPPGNGSVCMFRTDIGAERPLATMPFADCNSFITYVLEQERQLVSGNI